MAQHRRKHIVQVVGHAARQPPDRFQLAARIDSLPPAARANRELELARLKARKAEILALQGVEPDPTGKVRKPEAPQAHQSMGQ